MASPGQPIHFCFDGSDESRRAIDAAAGLLESSVAVVLTVWQPLSARLVETGAFGAFALEDETRVDSAESAAATALADEGVAQARAAGFDATARVEEAPETTWRAIVDVADEIDAGLIVCGTRGRGTVRTALLGSTSHTVLQHAGRPVLIAPEPRSAY